MTLPEACEGLDKSFRACVDSERLWGRLLGRCDKLKEEFEACLRKEVGFWYECGYLPTMYMGNQVSLDLSAVSSLHVDTEIKEQY